MRGFQHHHTVRYSCTRGSVSERPKVQHSKCCVGETPPWVQIPPLPPPEGPHPRDSAAVGSFVVLRTPFSLRFALRNVHSRPHHQLVDDDPQVWRHVRPLHIVSHRRALVRVLHREPLLHRHLDQLRSPVKRPSLHKQSLRCGARRLSSDRTRLVSLHRRTVRRLAV